MLITFPHHTVTHTSAFYPVSRPRPPAVWPLCRWLELEDELNCTTTSAPSVVGPSALPQPTAATVPMHLNAHEHRKMRKSSLYTCPRVSALALYRTGWPPVSVVYSCKRVCMLQGCVIRYCSRSHTSLPSVYYSLGGLRGLIYETSSENLKWASHTVQGWPRHSDHLDKGKTSKLPISISIGELDVC